MSRIAVGIIGFGFMGEVHLKHYKANPASENCRSLSCGFEQSAHALMMCILMMIMKNKIMENQMGEYLCSNYTCSTCLRYGCRSAHWKTYWYNTSEVDAVITKSRRQAKVMVGHS